MTIGTWIEVGYTHQPPEPENGVEEFASVQSIQLCGWDYEMLDLLQPYLDMDALEAECLEHYRKEKADHEDNRQLTER